MFFPKAKCKLLSKENTMAKRIFWTGILVMLLVFGIWFTACSTDSGEKYDPIVYTSKDTSGNTYKLTITKNTSKTAFTPESGDNYTLTITYANGTTKTSTGTVASYSGTELVFAGTTSFTVTITSSGTMTKIEGTITLDDNTKVTAPGALTPQDNNQGGTTPAANPFAGTSWKWEGQMPEEDGKTYNVKMTLSFGTDNTVTAFQGLIPPSADDFTVSGTYRVSGNTATITIEGQISTATINGNVLIFIGVSGGDPLTFTRVN